MTYHQPAQAIANTVVESLEIDPHLFQELPWISVIGLGYVGAVSTACLASIGHTVIGVDLDQKKVGDIASGRSPIHEADLGRLLEEGVAQGRVRATTDGVAAVAETDITFVSVGTPTGADGGCDDRAIVAAARSIGEAIRDKITFHVVVMRCSIPPGTTKAVMVREIEATSGKKAGVDFGVAFNPEFLREGTAIADFHAPPKTVIGVEDERSETILRDLYQQVDDNPLITSIEVAEMVKYVDNVWHATKVCFANEVGRFCKSAGVDSHAVMDIFVQDTKLNLSPYYLKPGFAFGGSCLPKEVRAVRHLAAEAGVDVPLIASLIPSNEAQIAAAVEAVRESGAQRIAVLGVAFKPGTDDLRESPILEVIDTLLREGRELTAFDPAIDASVPIEGQFDYMRYASPHLEKTIRVLPEMLCETAAEAVKEADAIIVTHADASYRKALAPHIGRRTVIDLARLYPMPVDLPGYRGIAW